MSARWRKVFADLWSNRARSALVVLSIAVGVFAVGVVSTSFSIVKRDMAADYFTINPHTMRISTDVFDDDLLPSLSRVPGVTAIEGRSDISVKITGKDGKQYQINCTSILPLDEIKVDQLVFEQGSRELGKREMYMERQGAEGLGYKVGDVVDVLLTDGRVRTLKLVGTLHDVNANPFKFAHQTGIYVNRDTMEWMGGSYLYWYVIASTEPPTNDEVRVRAIAEQVAHRIRQTGREVYNINVYHPGQHPAQSIIDATLALMSALGVLSVFLSAFLVVNTISALMSQQIRQIGVMKALGATMGQLIVQYLALVLAFGVLSLLVAVPLGALGASGLTTWLEGLLNTTPLPFQIPTTSLTLQIIIGLAVPLFGALVPVIGGVRLTVREAISSYGLSKPGERSLFDRLIGLVRGLPRPLLLSLRNTFRRKGRLLLTLSTLTLGGAIFIGVFSARDSMYAEIDQTYGYFLSDVNVYFGGDYLLDRVTQIAQGVPGITGMEGWLEINANIYRPNGVDTNQVVIFAPPGNTKLLDPVVTSGRWLLPTDQYAIVVDNHFVAVRPDVKVGDTLMVRIDKRDYPFKVVGIFKMAGNTTNPLTYANYEVISRLSGVTWKVNSLRIVTDRHDLARQSEVLEAVRTRFTDQKIQVYTETGTELKGQSRYTIDLLIYLLLAMAALIALVGGLGLMGTMSMNVLERTREIGVMRSIGAVNGSIFQLVVVEGILIGVISWALGAVVAIPIIRLLDSVMGVSLLNVPMVYVYSVQGLVIWLVVVLVLSTIASLLPANNAVRLTVRDVLAYE
jgi:putative ABC transport system permease protein